MPEFFINIKETGGKKAQEEIDKLTDATDKLGISLESTGKWMKIFKDEMAELSKTADELNNKLDEIIKKKEILK